MNKLLSYLPIIQVLTLILVVVILFSGNSISLGGTTNYDALDVTDGYSVDSITVIDGSGNLSLTGTRSATVSGATTLSGATVISGTLTASNAVSLNTTTTIKCLRVYDTTTTTTAYYITASSTTGTALISATKPDYCP